MESWRTHAASASERARLQARHAANAALLPAPAPPEGIDSSTAARPSAQILALFTHANRKDTLLADSWTRHPFGFLIALALILYASIFLLVMPLAWLAYAIWNLPVWLAILIAGGVLSVAWLLLGARWAGFRRFVRQAATDDWREYVASRSGQFVAYVVCLVTGALIASLPLLLIVLGWQLSFVWAPAGFVWADTRTGRPVGPWIFSEQWLLIGLSVAGISFLLAEHFLVGLIFAIVGRAKEDGLLPLADPNRIVSFRQLSRNDGTGLFIVGGILGLFGWALVGKALWPQLFQ